jgi:hypothetical protein
LLESRSNHSTLTTIIIFLNKLRPRLPESLKRGCSICIDVVCNLRSIYTKHEFWSYAIARISLIVSYRPKFIICGNRPLTCNVWPVGRPLFTVGSF